MKKLILFFSALFFCLLPLAGASYGGSVDKSLYRFRVNTSSSVFMRESPSKYGTKAGIAYDGDYIYCSYPEVVTGSGIEWLKFYQDGEGYRYIAYSYLTKESNPNTNTDDSGSAQGVQPQQRSYGWLYIVFLSLFAAITIVALIIIARSLCPYGGYMKYFLLGWSDKTGLRKMMVFNPNAYMTFLGITGTVLGSFITTFFIILMIAFIMLCLSYIGGILLWIVLIIGWILLVGGILMVVCGQFWGILVGLIGLPVVVNGDWFKDTAAYLFDAGVAMFSALNPWDLCVDIVITYWKVVLIAAAAPLALFLAVALLWLLVAGVVSLYEKIVMRRYNVKHPCPNCGYPSEPAKYIAGRTEDGTPITLPVHLQPGMYGIFSIVAPLGQGKYVKLPTLFLNGKDKLERICPHCNTVIHADMGQEKHIAVAGVAQSGKTTLLYRIIAELQRKYSAQITDNMGVNHTVISKFVDGIKSGNEMTEYPQKTTEMRHRSIQLMLSHKGASVPYKVYLNDLAGEMFTAESNRSDDAPFFRNTDLILFIIDPETMRASDLTFGAEFEEWYSKNVGKQSDVSGKIDLELALDILKNTIEKHRKRKSDIKNIPLLLVLTKADTGYLKDTDSSSPEALKNFIENEMGLGKFLYTAVTSFTDVTYWAVSAKSGADTEISGVNALINAIVEKLDIESGQ